MGLGLVGRKLGMTRVFTDEGVSIPVTVIEVQPNRVAQIRTVEHDGYSALQLTKGSKAEHKVSNAVLGHYAKADLKPGEGLWEFRVSSDEVENYNLGDRIGVDHFSVGQKVDVCGISIGKGFTGVMKRYGFGGGRATHGNSKAHRKPGSIGQNQTPGRVFPGKKMAGHCGNAKTVQQNLEVVRVDEDRSLLLVKGAVPGARNTNIMVTPAVKKKSHPARDSE